MQTRWPLTLFLQVSSLCHMKKYEEIGKNHFQGTVLA